MSSAKEFVLSFVQERFKEMFKQYFFSKDTTLEEVSKKNKVCDKTLKKEFHRAIKLCIDFNIKHKKLGFQKRELGEKLFFYLQKIKKKNYTKQGLASNDVKKLINEGKGVVEISDLLNLSQPSVRKIISEIKIEKEQFNHEEFSQKWKEKCQI
jgi:hypothetical protein